MAVQLTGLGKGLDALIRENHEAREGAGVQTLPLDAIIPNPRQPRRSFNEKALEELAASIRSQGLLQPLLVRPFGPSASDKYEIVAGERRWRASKMAGLTEVPVLIRAFSSQDTLAAALIENLQREDLNPLEEALGLQTLKEEYGLSQDDLAQKIGKSRSAIANSLRLLALPESMRSLLVDGKLSAGHARALLSVTDAAAQEYLKGLILENKLSVREAEGLAAGWKETGQFALSGLTGEADAPKAQESPGAAADAGVDGDEAPGPAAAKKGPRPQSARMLEIQNRMGELFHIPVRVTGKENKGKISFSFNSREELTMLLERLSSFALEAKTRTALQGDNAPVLNGAAHQALEGTERQELSGASADALTAQARHALDSSRQDALRAGEERKAISSGAQPSAAAKANTEQAAPEQETAEQGLSPEPDAAQEPAE